MKKSDISVCVLRVGGTNCDVETQRAFIELGATSKTVHINTLVKKRILLDYDILVLPGGFSYGDYVRAGAILAKEISVKLGRELKTFIEKGRPVLGICNGFQVLVEAGLLPALKGPSEIPEAALTTNFPAGFECRWISLKNEDKGKCVFLSKIGKNEVIQMPIAHAEGRFVLSKEKEVEQLNYLIENDQIIFRYCDKLGGYAKGVYPLNPNGSFHDIAGICDPHGTVFGLMPHPERAFYKWQLPDWTRRKLNSRPNIYGDGKKIFESVLEYVETKF